MIIVQLKGGLGNQMFQYAAARALAHHHDTELAVDASHYRTDQLRNFDLFQLQTKARLASSEEIDRLKAKGSVGRILNRIIPYSSKRFYKQPYYHFDRSFFNLGKEVYLQGFFQSEKYFAPIAPLLQEEFSLRGGYKDPILAKGSEMQQLDSVALHIRRGDYSNAETLRFHGILPLTYYRDAVELMRKKLDQPRFYIFSDDIQWVVENLQLEPSEAVSGKVSQTHFEDLYLMQQCRHNIIANSSFSWWGARLNTHLQKIVVAPLQWYNEGPRDTEDLIPAGWTRL